MTNTFNKLQAEETIHSHSVMHKGQNILLLILITLAPFHVSAQHIFAPVGAAWWHYNVQGPIMSGIGAPPGTASEISFSYHARSVADTVIDGISCRKVTTAYREKMNGPIRPDFGFGEGPVKDCYIYDNTDTVFVFNENFGRFTPMYVFTAQEGDTICLPVLPEPTPDLRVNPHTGDASFCFIIDSIRVLTYDTAHLRTFYTRAISEEGSGPFSTAYPAYNWGTTYDWNIGYYVERIGGPAFFPRHLVYCGDCTAISYGPYGSLACYSDSSYSIFLREGLACDSLPEPRPLGIEDPELTGDHILLYPVPGDALCRLAFRKPLSEEVIVQLWDISGRYIRAEKMRAGQSSLDMNTRQLSDGIYLLKIMKGNATAFRKLVVAH